MNYGIFKLIIDNSNELFQFSDYFMLPSEVNNIHTHSWVVKMVEMRSIQPRSFLVKLNVDSKWKLLPQILLNYQRVNREY